MSSTRPRKYQTGVNLLELMIVLVVASLLASLAVPTYDRYVQRAKVRKAMGDIGSLSLEIESFRLRNRDRVPDNLAELGVPIPDDPWGRPYIFLNIIDGGPAVIGAARKDGALNPLNTDYDLFSRGKDGEYAGPLNAGKSRDDVVRANDGAFIGLGEDY